MGRDIFHFLSGFPFHLTWIIKSQSQLEKEKERWMRKKNRNQKIINDSGIKQKPEATSINFSNELGLLSDCDLVIESISEDFRKKSELFAELGFIIRPDTIVATNTSSISIRSLIPNSAWKSRFVGLHFFYPVKFKNLVEVNILPETSGLTIEVISGLLNGLHRKFLLFDEVNHFLMNRLFLPVQAEAYTIHKEEKIPYKLLDDLAKDILFPDGIFSFFDQVGIDVMYNSVTNYLSFYEDKPFLKPLADKLREMKDNDRLGIKNGLGFFNYKDERSPETSLPEESIDKLKQNHICDRLIRSYLTTIFETNEKGILNQKDLEYILKEYTGIGKSPFELAKEIGFTL